MNQTIKELINNKEDKKITYAEYIEAVLYHRTKGYYMKQKPKLGKSGDFYTSSMVNDVFGKVFVPCFLEIITKENLPFHICEIGGGDGRFAEAFLNEWSQQSPETFQKLSYSLIESSPYHRQEQTRRLADYKQVLQYETIAEMREDIPTYQGIIFSNELLDAFPVHVVEQQQRELFEIFITIEHDQLVETKETCTNQRIFQWLQSYGPTLSDGQRIEIPLYMSEWLQEISSWVTQGGIFTIDYGYTNEGWTEPERKDGSLRGYYQHQLINNVLQYPGDMDITSHIHVDALKKMGEELGLKNEFMMRQDRFLLSIGLLSYLQNNFDPDPFSYTSKQNRAIRSLITQGGMSSAFQVIFQQKNLTNIHSYQCFNEDPFSAI